jgi:hypothetical protein
MSTDELEKFKKLYAEYLEEIVNLHNAQYVFLRRLGRDSVFMIRRHHKKIIKIQKELYKTTGLVYKEHRENTKERLANQRVQRAYNKANPKTPERKKKNEQHNNTNASSI